LEPAFATTVHKSQGSEFPIIILPVYPANTMMQSRNLLYTAITRAKKLVILVGQETALSQMIENNNEFRRHSALGERLKY
jgi:exodeoxyribonuclease V alpha subunit